MNGFPVRPVRGYVYLLDDQPETVEKGVVVRRRFGTFHHDFTVVAVGHGVESVRPGDVAVMKDPNAGRGFMADGIVYRIVKESELIGRMDIR